VDFQEGPGPLSDRRLVVGESGPVRGAHLAEDRSSLDDDLGDAEPSADLDELGAGDDDLAARGEGGQDEQHRPRVVVDHDRVLGAAERRGKPPEVIVPGAAAPGLEVVLEVGVAGRDAGEALQGGRGERGAPEVRVHDDARGVDHATESRLEEEADLCSHRLVVERRFRGARRLTFEDRPATGFDGSTDRLGHGPACPPTGARGGETSWNP
jgi:hypothetical protein